MKKITKFIFSFFIFMIILSLAACFTSNNENDSKNETTQYTVTYYINSDTITNVSKKYDKGTTLTTEMIEKDAFNNSTPTKVGYTLENWYTDSTYSTSISFPIIINSDRAMYLKWIETTTSDPNIPGDTPGDNTGEDNTGGNNTIEPTTYTITYYTDNTKYNEETVNSNSIAAGVTSPTKTGYTFDGWYLENTFVNKFDFTTAITSNITLYAKFTIKTFIVEFLDEFGNALATQQTIEYNNTVLKPDDPSKDNYLFDNWYTDLEYTDIFDFNNKITSNTKIYAKFTLNLPSSSDITVTKSGGYNEGAYIEFTKLEETSLSDYTITYKLASSSTNITLDEELIRENDTTIRADIVGLTKGTYSITINVNDTKITETINNIEVYEADRSGYAHFVTSTNAIGAYNEDGSLKSNADIIYVTNETKNTVTYGGKTGLVAILQNAKNFDNPVVVRIIGQISTNQWKTKDVEPRLYDNSNYTTSAEDEAFITNEMETTYGENLVGLAVNVMDKKYETNYKYVTTKTGVTLSETSSTSKSSATYNRNKYSNITGQTVYDDDSYFNMLDISNSKKGLTIEGIGTDAEIFQWGFTFKTCSNIEIKNLTFTNAPEDACSFEGSSGSESSYVGYWIHNNTFNRGVNNWDISGERDKYAGDGAMDLKYCRGVTASYNTYNNCKKTGLVGGSDTNLQYDITFHHNYYNEVESRLPLGRQANMHIYNNYYYKCNVTQDLRANAYALSEANYFEQSLKPRTTIKEASNYYPFIKSYNDYYDSCDEPSSSYGTAYEATSRDSYPSTYDSTVNGCNINGTDYSKFDTNSTLFYYDSTNKKSNVTYLTTAQTAKTDCINNSGVLKGTFVGTNSGTNDSNDDDSSDDNTSSDNNGEAITTSTIITFNDLSTASSVTTDTTSGIITIKGSKSYNIKETDTTIDEINTTITRYINLSGSGAYDSCSIQFTTTKKANITVYYSSTGSSGTRYVNLLTEDSSTKASNGASSTTITSDTFNNVEAGSYAIASAGSGLNIYCIVIEYLE